MTQEESSTESGPESKIDSAVTVLKTSDNGPAILQSLERLRGAAGEKIELGEEALAWTARLAFTDPRLEDDKKNQAVNVLLAATRNGEQIGDQAAVWASRELKLGRDRIDGQSIQELLIGKLEGKSELPPQTYLDLAICVGDDIDRKHALPVLAKAIEVKKQGGKDAIDIALSIRKLLFPNLSHIKDPVFLEAEKVSHKLPLETLAPTGLEPKKRRDTEGPTQV